MVKNEREEFTHPACGGILPMGTPKGVSALPGA